MLDYDQWSSWLNVIMVDDFKDFQAYGTVTFVNMPTYEVEQSAIVYYYVEHLMQNANLFISKDFFYLNWWLSIGNSRSSKVLNDFELYCQKIKVPLAFANEITK